MPRFTVSVCVLSEFEVEVEATSASETANAVQAASQSYGDVSMDLHGYAQDAADWSTTAKLSDSEESDEGYGVVNGKLVELWVYDREHESDEADEQPEAQ